MWIKFLHHCKTAKRIDGKFLFFFVYSIANIHSKAMYLNSSIFFFFFVEIYPWNWNISYIFCQQITYLLFWIFDLSTLQLTHTNIHRTRTHTDTTHILVLMLKGVHNKSQLLYTYMNFNVDKKRKARTRQEEEIKKMPRFGPDNIFDIKIINWVYVCVRVRARNDGQIFYISLRRELFLSISFSLSFSLSLFVFCLFVFLFEYRWTPSFDAM